MSKIIKHIDHESIIRLSDQVEVLKGQVVSKTLVQNDHVGITLFAFDKGEQISSHDSTGDAMVNVLEGIGQFTIGETVYELKQGESMVMPANIPHAVYAKESFKMCLVVIFPQIENK